MLSMYFELHARQVFLGGLSTFCKTARSEDTAFSDPWRTRQTENRSVPGHRRQVYGLRTGRPPSQTWRTFHNNHASQLASTDFFVVPTVTFRLLYVFIALTHQRSRVIHFNVTAHPSSESTARPSKAALR